MLKKIRPWIGVLLFVSLMLLGRIVVFISLAASLIFPILWLIFTALHVLKPLNKTLTYFWNGARFSMWIYFASFFLFLAWTPSWMKRLSLFLENKSLFTIFEAGSYMYGRIFIAFLLALICLAVFFVAYQVDKRRTLKTVKDF